MFRRGAALRPLPAVVAGLFFFAVAPIYGECTVNCAASVPATASAGSPVSFQSGAAPCNCGEMPSYSWTFGDGGTSSQANAEHSYSAGGTYSWQLSVTADGQTCTRGGSIIVTGGSVTPLAGTYVGSTAQGSFSLTVNGSNQITGWSFSYGNFCSSSGSASTQTTCTINNGSFTCGSASCAPYALLMSISGTFDTATTVSGTVTAKYQPSIYSGCCTTTPAFSATLSPAPLQASASGAPTTGESPLLVNFTGAASGGTAPYSYSWDFGDCSAPATEQNPSHSFATGTWPSILTVTDSAGSPNTARAFVTITATPPPAVLLQISAPPTAVAGTPFTATVTARDASGDVAVGYTGTVAFSSNDPSPTLPSNYTFTTSDAGVHAFTGAFNLPTPGARTVTVTDTVDGLLTATANITTGYSTAVNVTSSPNPTAQSATATLTATVTSGTAGSIGGTVTFKDGLTSLGTAPVSTGTANLTISFPTGGPHSITGEYSGDSNYLASLSSPHTHYVLLSAPVITATGTSGSSVSVTWPAVPGAVLYEVLRSGDNVSFASRGTTASPSFTDTIGLSANTAYFYRVRGLDGGGNDGASSATDVAVTIAFTDPALTAGMIVKAAHITELRTAVNAVRTAGGLAGGNYTGSVNSGTVVLADHVQDLRDALTEARNQLVLPGISFTDPALTPGSTQIRALHISQLRSGVQ